MTKKEYAEWEKKVDKLYEQYEIYEKARTICAGFGIISWIVLTIMGIIAMHNLDGMLIGTISLFGMYIMVAEYRIMQYKIAQKLTNLCVGDFVANVEFIEFLRKNFDVEVEVDEEEE